MSASLDEAPWKKVETGVIDNPTDTGFFMLEEVPADQYKIVDGKFTFQNIEKPKDQEIEKSTKTNAEPKVSEKRKKKKKRKKTKESGEKNENEASALSSNEQTKTSASNDNDDKESDRQEQLETTAGDYLEWDQYGLHEKILSGLQKLEFKSPTEIQKACLPRAIRDGRDILGAAETGSGKTLAYGIPMLNNLLHSPPNDDDKLAALVLAPTRELAIQVQKHFEQVLVSGDSPKICRVATVVGGMSLAKQERVLRQKPHVLIATPGRFWSLVQQGEDHLSDLASSLRFLVIDEADRMFDRGHFPELKPFIELLQRSRMSSNEGTKRNKRQTFLFSATLMCTREYQKKRKSRKRRRGQKSDQSVSPLQELMQQIGLRGKPALCSIEREKSEDREETTVHQTIKLPKTLRMTEIMCTDKDKATYAYYFLTQHRGRTLIFVNTIAVLRRLTAILLHLKVQNLGSLHANMQQRQRLKHLDRFRSNQSAVLVATDVAARGLDIPEVKYVIHYGASQSSETYVHRSGRTARASKDGLSLSLVSPREVDQYNSIKRQLNIMNRVTVFNVDTSFMPPVKDRVQIATRLQQVQHRLNSKKADKDWFAENAAQAEIEIDMTQSEQESIQQNKQKREAKRLTRDLNALLSQRITPVGSSKKFITVNPMLLDEESFRGPNFGSQNLPAKKRKKRRRRR